MLVVRQLINQIDTRRSTASYLKLFGLFYLFVCFLKGVGSRIFFTCGNRRRFEFGDQNTFKTHLKLLSSLCLHAVKTIVFFCLQIKKFTTEYFWALVIQRKTNVKQILKFQPMVRVRWAADGPVCSCCRLSLLSWGRALPHLTAHKSRSTLLVRCHDITQMLNMNHPSGVDGFWSCGYNYAEKMQFEVFSWTAISNKLYGLFLVDGSVVDGFGFLPEWLNGGGEYWGFACFTP